MSMIPCKQCTCGYYHDFTVSVCPECGKNLESFPMQPLEVDQLGADRYGEIDDTLTVYVQKCPACGALNFTPDPEQRVKRCFNCVKSRVASVRPTLWSAEPEQQPAEAPNVGSDAKDVTQAEASAAACAKKAAAFPKPAPAADSDDEEAAKWSSLLGSVMKNTNPQFMKTTASAFQPKKQTEPAAAGGVSADEDDEDDVSPAWSGILGVKKAKAQEQQQAKPCLTLRAGSLSFTVSPDRDSPYLLGRSANQSTFLSTDRRVGNEHCYLVFKNGAWYVKDNHSSNGTAVNSIDIGLNGEQVLKDGDELKLGHHPDSPIFRIALKK